MAKNIMRNPYIVLFYCLMFAFFSSYAIEINYGMYIVIFILISILTFIIRPITEIYLKATSYLSLGMLSYWMISKDFILSPPGPTPALFVLFGLAVLNGLVALVSYSDGRLSGYSFSAGALALLFMNLQNPYSFFSAALIFLSSHTVVYFVSRIKDSRCIPEAVLKASLISSTMLYLSAIFQMWIGISSGVSKIPSHFVFGTSLIYLSAISALAIWSVLWVFEFFLCNFKYARALEGETIVYHPIRSRRTTRRKS